MASVTLKGEPAATTALSALRAFVVVLGGPVVLAGIATASSVATVRALCRGRRPRRTAMIGTAATIVYGAVVRPWLRNWGASPDEVAKALPGEELVSDDKDVSTRAVTIHAPVVDVWPWLAQLGQDRGGFYSYEWLENAAGCQMRNADRIHPEWQHRDLGETVLLHPASGLKMTLFEPPHVFGLEQWGTFVLEARGPGQTRLIARGISRPGFLWWALGLLWEIPHFVMERKMLLGIKQRAESIRGPA